MTRRSLNSDWEGFEFGELTEILISVGPDVCAVASAKTSPNSEFNSVQLADEGSQSSHWDLVLFVARTLGISSFICFSLVSVMHQFLETDHFSFEIKEPLKFE